MMRADLGKDPSQVSAMFDGVAAKYDRTNNVLSVGNAPLWRVATTRTVAPKPGERILDVGAGTGTSSASLAKSGASVVAVDFSPGMIAEGRVAVGPASLPRGRLRPSSKGTRSFRRDGTQRHRQTA